MKKFVLLLLCLSPLAAMAQVEHISGTITSSQTVVIQLSTKTSTVVIQVTGTWTGTLQPQGVVQGNAAANLQVTPSTSSTAQSTITANGTYTATVAGYDSFQILGNTVATGTANIYLNSSTAGSTASSSGGTPGGAASGDLGGNYPSPTVTATHLASALPINQGGTAAATLTAHSFMVGEGTSALAFLTSPATNGNCVVSFNVSSSATVDPTCGLPGVSVNAQSGSYALLYSDRASYIKLSGGTTATLTLPQVTGTTASNFPFVVQNLNSGLLTIAANAADSIDGGSTGGSVTVPAGFAAFVYQDSSSAPGNWWTIKLPTLVSGGSFTISPGGTGGATSKPATNQTFLWAFKAPTTVVSSTKLAYAVQTADNTANLNNLAIFDSGGNLICQTGATAGTTLAPSTGVKQINWTTPCGPIVQNKEYYFAQTFVTSTMVLGGQASSFSPLCATNPSSNNATASAVWTTPIGIPADSTSVACATPYMTVY